MAKESRKQQRTAPTRKQTSRVEREQSLNRIINTALIVIVAAVVLLVVGGLVYNQFIIPPQKIAVVEGEKITTDEYQDRVRVERAQIINNYLQYVQNFSMFQSSPEYQLQILEQIRQIEFQMNSEIVGNNVLEGMIQEVLVQQEAEARGITVSEEEVDEYFESILGYFPDGVPTATTAPTMLPTSTLSATQLALVTLTPTATEAPPSPTPEEAVPTATDIPPLPTATEYTLESYQEQLDQFYEQYSQDSVEKEDLRAIIRGIIYEEKLIESFEEEIPTTQTQVWARHILVETEEQANDILQKLADGEDWGALAAEFSNDTSNKDRGGDLGWFTEDRMVDKFAAVAFSIPVGEISEPVESQFGWHIIQVLGKEDRPLTPQQITTLAQNEFNAWITERRQEADIEINEAWVNRVPDDPAIPAQYRIPDGLEATLEAVMLTTPAATP